ncbi:MAG: YARHG domain-containing protein [Coriobacteriales bacterium]|jgi:hypothetical protein|nr:YARHG domain-containing protein [Coriobacteriales bacterium]
MFCANCGAKLEEGALFCAECGTKVDLSEVAPAQNEPAESKPAETKTASAKTPAAKTATPKASEPPAKGAGAETPAQSDKTKAEAEHPSTASAPTAPAKPSSAKPKDKTEHSPAPGAAGKPAKVTSVAASVPTAASPDKPKPQEGHPAAAKPVKAAPVAVSPATAAPATPVVEPAAQTRVMPAQTAAAVKSAAPTRLASPNDTAVQPVVAPPTAQAAASPAAPKAKKKLSKKAKRLIIIIAAIVVVLVAAAIITVNVLANTTFAPKNIVQQYYNDIANGDIVSANAVIDPGLDTATQTMLVDGTLADPRNRISNVSIGELEPYSTNGESGYTMQVTYTLGGVNQTTQASIVEDGNQYLFFKKYKVASSVVQLVPLDASTIIGGTITVNGVSVTVPIRDLLSDNQEALNLPVYPGLYAVSFPASDFVTSNTLNFIVADSVASKSEKSADNAYQFAVSFTKKMNKQVVKLEDKYVQSFMGSDPAPAGVPFDAVDVPDDETDDTDSYTYTFNGWSSISPGPTITPLEGDARINGDAPNTLSDGAIYYGTSTGGQVNCSYTEKYTYQTYDYGTDADGFETETPVTKTETTVYPEYSELNDLSLYVLIDGGKLTLEDADGNALSNLTVALSTPKAGGGAKTGSGTPTTTVSTSINDILPNSGKTLLTSADLEPLSAEQLEIAVNEIYARHGYKFKKIKALNTVFYSKSGPYGGRYKQNKKFRESQLSKTESKNAKLIRSQLKSLGYSKEKALKGLVDDFLAEY